MAGRFAVITRQLGPHATRRLVSTDVSLAPDAEVVLEEFALTRQVTLARPTKLNTLTLGMIRTMQPVYRRWAQTPNAPILLRGAGERAFCAGGDVAAIATNAGLRRDFFFEEYQLDYAIARYPGPQVAVYRGFVMGGGVGVSIHGSHRVATDSSVWAMPETAIGLFPDVGASWVLPRLPTRIPNLGLYLALTGNRLKGLELKEAGVATHFVPLDRLPALETSLRNLDPGGWPSNPLAARDAVTKLLTGFEDQGPPPHPTPLATNASRLARCFAGHSVEEIIDNLQADESLWASGVLTQLRKCSPTGLKIAFEAHRRGASLGSLAECLAMEFNVAQNCMRTGSDFFEGVRAVVVDKDQKPRWCPATLAEVTQADVDAFFRAPTGAPPWQPAWP